MFTNLDHRGVGQNDGLHYIVDNAHGRVGMQAAAPGAGWQGRHNVITMGPQ